VTALALLREEAHSSVSSITTYLRCPRKYEHRYIVKTPVEHRASALAFGGVLHEALAFFYAAIRDDRPEPTHEELAQVFRDAWKRELDGDLPILFGEKESAISLTIKGAEMLKVFLEKAPRYAEVIAVEESFRMELIDPETGEVLPPLIGVFDAVVRDENDRTVVLEHKTGARKWTDDKLAFDPQLSAYHLAATELGLGKNASVSVQLLTKTKKADLHIYNPTRTKADHDDFITTAAGVWRAVNAGVSYPVRDWWCKGCEYASGCVAG
jgi:CRISPR/Cas system-associated exonuclease Cas4 (RecB family)